MYTTYISTYSHATPTAFKAAASPITRACSLSLLPLTPVTLPSPLLNPVPLLELSCSVAPP